MAYNFMYNYTIYLFQVCDQTSPYQREVLAIISSNIVPALLIISEVFLLITFVLHVIVPDFRKQMFGE